MFKALALVAVAATANACLLNDCVGDASCCDGAYCSTFGLCFPVQTFGGKCNSQRPCTEGLTCQDKICQQTPVDIAAGVPEPEAVALPTFNACGRGCENSYCNAKFDVCSPFPTAGGACDTVATCASPSSCKDSVCVAPNVEGCATCCTDDCSDLASEQIDGNCCPDGDACCGAEANGFLCCSGEETCKEEDGTYQCHSDLECDNACGDISGLSTDDGPDGNCCAGSINQCCSITGDDAMGSFTCCEGEQTCNLDPITGMNECAVTTPPTTAPAPTAEPTAAPAPTAEPTAAPAPTAEPTVATRPRPAATTAEPTAATRPRPAATTVEPTAAIRPRPAAAVTTPPPTAEPTVAGARPRPAAATAQPTVASRTRPAATTAEPPVAARGRGRR